MTIETNRFTKHEKCERCKFPYGWHVCLAPEILALDRAGSNQIEKPKRTIRGEMTQERREKISEAASKRWTAERVRNEKRNQNIAYDYEIDWLTVKELSVKYKISKDTVVRVLEEEGVDIRPRGLTKDTYNLRMNILLVKDDYVEKRMSLDEVAKKWGVAARTVARVLQEDGVKMRPASRRTKYTFN